jgi:hypothetical protein
MLLPASVCTVRACWRKFAAIVAAGPNFCAAPPWATAYPGTADVRSPAATTCTPVFASQ